MFSELIKPKFESEIIKELTESAQELVLKKCGEQMKKLIEIKPYKHQQFIKILSFSLDDEENVIAGLINEVGSLFD